MTQATLPKTSFSTMTPRERLLAVYRGEPHDCVASLADLSYWYAGNGGGKFIPGHTDGANYKQLEKLLALHNRTGAAIHLNMGSYFDVRYGGGIRVESGIRGEHYVHRFETPVGTVEEVREWSDISFSWPILHHMIQQPEDLKIIRYIFENTEYYTDWKPYHDAIAQIGEWGVPLVQGPYTGMGFLMSRYAGIESTVLFSVDCPEELEQTVQTINATHRVIWEQLVDGPSQIMFISDNLSSDVQHPAWFYKYSGDYYRWMAQRARAAGKPLVVHVDGRLRGLMAVMTEVGVAAVDAATPAPHGDLTPTQCRDEGGDQLVLSGGIPPVFFHSDVSLATFDKSVEEWLALADRSSAVIIAPGDQLPPLGEIDRVTRMVEMANARRY
ncbi:MAG: hypothetical protein IT448_09155 [Phycisphaerales bacterium]|nr:hypothetical protein [Phycisphaerales bacterium]